MPWQAWTIIALLFAACGLLTYAVTTLTIDRATWRGKTIAAWDELREMRVA